jgi:hypothetical protein
MALNRIKKEKGGEQILFSRSTLQNILRSAADQFDSDAQQFPLENEGHKRLRMTFKMQAAEARELAQALARGESFTLTEY